MGVETRKPVLPTQTESSINPSPAESTEVDLATDLSRQTDRTSYSIPEDGREITISKKRKDKHEREHGSKLSRTSHQSQTSLLIEYFEGGKDPDVRARPSVRVRVTPSAARKIKSSNEHIQVTESKGSRKPSYTRRISLGPHSSGEVRTVESADDRSISSYTSAAEDSSLAHRHPPVEIEVMHPDAESDLSTLSARQDDRYALHNPSEISSMPPDSMLEERPSNTTPRHSSSRRASREAVVTADTLKTPSRRRSRSLSKERLVHKAMEKVASRPRESSSGKQKRSSRSTRSRSVSSEQLEPLKTPKRRSKHHREEELVSGAESSVLTDSQLPQRQSGDQYSFRSTTSKSSINAKLLETVENVIRRTIMPELENLKQEQKMQKIRHKYEDDSVASGSSMSRGGEVTRKLSKHASAPNVSGRPKVVLNRDESNAGIVLSGDSIREKKDRRRSRKSDSPSEYRSERGMSEETVIRDSGKPSRRKSKEGHHWRDAATGGIAGGVLTAAALDYHDSKSSGERKERRKRRTKSHSRSTSYTESTEDIFRKLDVPPMPMQSEIHSSDITRDSILSERTDGTSSPTAEVRRAEIRQLSRGAPREIYSPSSRTPTKSPSGQHKGLVTRRSKLSQSDLSHNTVQSDQSPRDDHHHSKVEEATLLGAAAGGGLLAGHHSSNMYNADEGYDYEHQTRALSPVQSVSSRAASEMNRDDFGHKSSSGSLAAVKQEEEKRRSGISAKSVSSVASANVVRSNRPKGINLEPKEDVLDQHHLRNFETTEEEISDRDLGLEKWEQEEHEKNDRYRDSMGDSIVEYRRMTNFTDDSMDVPSLDQVTAAQERQEVGASRNPDYRSTPVAVESAVASLLDPSVISARSKQDKSYADSQDGDRMRDSTHLEGVSREVSSIENGHNGHLQDKELSDKSFAREELLMEGSPRQSIVQSVDNQSEHVHLSATAVPDAGNPMPEIGHEVQSDSDISTNPSIIRGPMGGTQAASHEHWYPHYTEGEHLSRSKDSSVQESLKAAAAGFLNKVIASQRKSSEEDHAQPREMSLKDDYQSHGDDYAVNHDFAPTREPYLGRNVLNTPKDEGYQSAGPQRERQSPEIAFKDATSFNDIRMGDLDEDGDPFVSSQKHARHLSTNSGLAQGMGSPLYDSATGGGMDRIHSKDIVALMDHLTVRDQQRNARDTEILVTLVRSAAEMRNSFEEMKKFIAEQDDILVEVGNKQHDRTIEKILIGGPRPQPVASAKYLRRSSADDDTDDTPNKKRNVFRRALKGLSNRNSNDIGKIEEMLVQLLGEVEGLKAVQGIRPSAAETREESPNLYTNARTAGADGYEPEGQAGTSSTDPSGYFSNPSSRGPSAMRGLDVRHGSQNRVSTVLEADEELEEHEQQVLDHQFENNERLATPTKEQPRADSVPLATPPQMQVPSGAQSNDHTPKSAAEKSRKHRSSNSSVLPKFMSRWSKTTASSTGDNFRNSARKERPFSEASRSGDLQQYDTTEHYDHTGDDRLRSNVSMENDDELDNRPPSPLIPSQVSEDPKYQAHRNSLNLQHPQPRPGPTHRYQHQLETQAQNYGSRSPISPTSDTFGSDPTLARLMPGATNRYSNGHRTLSPISDAGYSDASASDQVAPPRPPKIKDDGPLVPSSSGPVRPPKLATSDNKPTFASPLHSEHLQPDQRYSNGSAYDSTKESPRSASGAAPQRKPTGPRPITSSGSYSPDKEGIRRSRYRASPNRIDSAEDETF